MPKAPRPGRQPLPLQLVDVRRGQPAAPAPQPLLDRLVRLLSHESRGGLVQQAVPGGRLGAGQDAVAVHDQGLGLDEVEHLGPRERQRQLALLHGVVGCLSQGNDREVPCGGHERLHVSRPSAGRERRRLPVDCRRAPGDECPLTTMSSGNPIRSMEGARRSSSVRGRDPFPRTDDVLGRGLAQWLLKASRMRSAASVAVSRPSRTCCSSCGVRERTAGSVWSRPRSSSWTMAHVQSSC